MKFFSGINISTVKTNIDTQTLLEALEANSLEHKLEMQIKAAFEKTLNERETSELMSDTLSIPSINNFHKAYGKRFEEINSMYSLWYNKVSQRNPIYYTDTRCKTSAGEYAYNLLSSGKSIFDKELKRLGTISVMEHNNTRYLRFIPKDSDNIFFIFR